jgi:hypothetical protein
MTLCKVSTVPVYKKKKRLVISGKVISQYFQGSTAVLTGEYYSTAVKVLKYCKGSTFQRMLSYLQKSHQEGVRKDKFLFSDDKSDIQIFLIIVEFHNFSLAEFLVGYGTSRL